MVHIVIFDGANSNTQRRIDAVSGNTRKWMKKLDEAQKLNQEVRESIAASSSGHVCSSTSSDVGDLDAGLGSSSSASAHVGDSSKHTASSASAHVGDSGEHTAPSSAYSRSIDGVANAEANAGLSPSSNSATTANAKKCLRRVSIKKRLFDDAKALHHRYVNNEELSDRELKRMSIGLSGILDCTCDDQADVLNPGNYAYV